MKKANIKKLKIGDYLIQHWVKQNEIKLVQVVQSPPALVNEEFWNKQTYVIDIPSKSIGDIYHIDNTEDCHYYKVEDKNASG